jgi:hypothetical protein
MLVFIIPVAEHAGRVGGGQGRLLYRDQGGGRSSYYLLPSMLVAEEGLGEVCSIEKRPRSRLVFILPATEHASRGRRARERLHYRSQRRRLVFILPATEHASSGEGARGGPLYRDKKVASLHTTCHRA